MAQAVNAIPAKITTKNLLKGVEQAYWPGRLHKIFLNLPEKNFIDVKIWLDGSHNASSGECLSKSIKFLIFE